MLHEGCWVCVSKLMIPQVCTNAVTAEVKGTVSNNSTQDAHGVSCHGIACSSCWAHGTVVSAPTCSPISPCSQGSLQTCTLATVGLYFSKGRDAIQQGLASGPTLFCGFHRRDCMPGCLEHPPVPIRVSLKLMLHSYVQALKASACLSHSLGDVAESCT